MKATFFTCLFGVAVNALSRGFGTAAYSNSFGRGGQNASFDYVIVGGGTGGLAVANRIAANGTFSVAVVEAGGFYEDENGNLTVVPGYYSDNVGSASIDWNFQTIPQPSAMNQTFTYDRGRTLGGSSALNAMLYQRGTRQSYQYWADKVGDDSYTLDALLPFFEKSVRYTPPNATSRALNATVPLPNATAFAGSHGPLEVSFPNWATPFASWAQLAFREIGISDIPDFSSGNLLGSQYCPMTINPHDQTRSSSQASFLQQSLNEDAANLQLYIHSMAKQILFNAKKTATGVLVETAGVEYTLAASREVILSAGCFQSPQLLMISGVGPRSTLEAYNISVLADRPGVGQNLQDHVLFPVLYEVDVLTQQALNDPVFAAAASKEYNERAQGILTNQAADYLGWEKLPEANFRQLSNATKRALSEYPADWPELELVVGSFLPTSRGFQVSQTAMYAYLEIALIAPLSRGSVSISSGNIFDPPVIDVGWLSNSSDVEMAVQAIKRGRDFFGTSAIQPVLTSEEILPGKNVSTDAEIAQYVREYIQTVYHASCTCAMGKVEDPMAVIDSKARVIGVSGLRVVDASSFPFLIPGHPQSTIYGLAEKIAVDVLQE